MEFTSTTILIVILVVLAVIVLICLVVNAQQRAHHDAHHGGDYHHAKCVPGAPRPGAPTGLTASSTDTFTVNASWTAPSGCEIDHYCIYIKNLDACPTPVNATRRQVGHHAHSQGCTCHICQQTPVQYVPVPTPATNCGAGPEDYDRVQQVSGADRSCVITGLTSPAVIISVTAVDGCGQESVTSDCVTVCVNTDCRVYPCIVQDDCRGVDLRWNRVSCADMIRVYYDGVLTTEIPGDAAGVKGLPAMGQGELATDIITIRTVNSGGESQDWPVTTECPTYSSYSHCGCQQSSCNGSCGH